MSESKLSGSTFPPSAASELAPAFQFGAIMPPASTHYEEFQATTSEDMIMQPPMDSQYFDAQDSSLHADTARQKDLREIEDCADSWSDSSIGSLSLCLSTIIADATATQAKLLSEATAMELNLADETLAAEIDMAATARADFLFKETVSVMLNHTTTSTTSSLSSPATGTRTSTTTTIVSKRSFKSKRQFSRLRAASSKDRGGKNQQLSMPKMRTIDQPEAVSPRTSNQSEVSLRSTNDIELSEDRLYSYKVKTDGKLARCLAGDRNAASEA